MISPAAMNEFVQDFFSCSDLLKRIDSEKLTSFLVHNYKKRIIEVGSDGNSLTIPIVLEKLRQEGPRQICQYQFKKNDIVWMCKTCQRDEVSIDLPVHIIVCVCL